MGLHAREPGPPLRGLIERLWDWDMPQAAHHLERVLPKPGASIILNLHEDQTRTYSDDAARRCTRLSGSTFGGPGLRSLVIDTAEQVRVMGVVFRPGGAGGLLREDMRVLAGRDTDLADLFGKSVLSLRQRLLDTPAPQRRLDLLESWLVARTQRDRVDARVTLALNALERQPQATRVALLARDLDVSERRLHELFSRQVGMGPKRYARQLRFRRVIDCAYSQVAVDWAALATDSGYCDQAHLVHEFRQFAGITPTRFMTMRGPYRDHLPLD